MDANVLLSQIADLVKDYGAEAADTDMAALNVVKAEEEHRYTLGLAYPAMKPEIGRAHV